MADNDQFETELIGRSFVEVHGHQEIGSRVWFSQALGICIAEAHEISPEEAEAVGARGGVFQLPLTVWCGRPEDWYQHGIHALAASSIEQAVEFADQLGSQYPQEMQRREAAKRSKQ